MPFTPARAVIRQQHQKEHAKPSAIYLGVLREGYYHKALASVASSVWRDCIICLSCERVPERIIIGATDGATALAPGMILYVDWVTGLSQESPTSLFTGMDACTGEPFLYETSKIRDPEAVEFVMRCCAKDRFLEVRADNGFGKVYETQLNKRIKAL